MVLETLFGGVFGGILRLAPEVLKLLDRKSERQHELNLLEREMSFAEKKAELNLRESETKLTLAEVDAMSMAFREQAETAKSAGWFVAAVSALVRPVITYIFAGIYLLVKAAAYTIAVEQGGMWNHVLTEIWSAQDMAVLNMILTFWFVGRVYERTGSK